MASSVVCRLRSERERNGRREGGREKEREREREKEGERGREGEMGRPLQKRETYRLCKCEASVITGQRERERDKRERDKREREREREIETQENKREEKREVIRERAHAPQALRHTYIIRWSHVSFCSF